MQIEVKGRNTPVNDELREYVEKRFRKVASRCRSSPASRWSCGEERTPRSRTA